MADMVCDTKGGEYRRVEVLTGPGRRRPWDAATKARAVAESDAPGAVVSAVARRWQIAPQQLFGWRREARAGLLALPSEVADPATPAFVPIVAETAPPPPVEAAAAVPPSTPAIEVEITGAVVRVVAGTDGALLAAVLRVVRDSASST